MAHRSTIQGSYAVFFLNIHANKYKKRLHLTEQNFLTPYHKETVYIYFQSEHDKHYVMQTLTVHRNQQNNDNLITGIQNTARICI